MRDRRFDEAARQFVTAIEKHGPTADLLGNLSEVYARLGRLEDALSACERLIHLDPSSARAWQLLGAARRRLQKLDPAVEALRKVVEIGPDLAEGHYELALALVELKQLKEAKRSFLRAAELRPDYADAFNNLGVVCQELEQLDEAVRHLREAVRLAPVNVSALNNLGVALSEQRKYDESIGAFHKVLALDPEYIIAWNNLANSLRALGRNQEAATLLRRVVQRKPDYAEAYNNLALVQVQMGHFAEAMRNFDRALILRPEYPECRVNRAMKYLMAAEFERGWTDYEWRWHTKHLRGRQFRGRKWDGSSLAGKRILLGSEQGLGDTFQFIRYAAELKQRGATVIFEGQPEVRQILARTPGVDEFVPRGERLPRFDVYAPLLSLPGVLQTTLENVPAAVPYIFPDPDMVARWKPRLGSLGGRVRVGIVWQGNPRFGSDNRRSSRLSFFEPLARIEGVRLVSLQRGFGSEQVPELSGAFEVTTFAGIDEQSDGFLRTAAILKNLDLVIAVDTGVAHLAGAMGVPVWLVIPFANDWRWLSEREDTPWYPTMRLFRQKEAGDWEELLGGRVARALRERVNEPSPAASKPTDAQRRQHEGLLREAAELSKSGDRAGARERLEQAAALDPGDWRAYHDIGVIHAERGQFGQAIGLFRRAIGLAPSAPTAYANLGLAFYDNGQTEEAVGQLRSAVRLGGGTPEVHNNLSLALARLGGLPAAESSLLTALRLRPDYAAAHYNLSKVLLAQEKFEQGWLEYEWRDRAAGRAPPKQYRGPRWAGENVRGRTLLLHAEQDPAAAVQFLRFASTFKKAGARVIVSCPPQLKRLVGTCPFVDEAVEQGDQLPGYDLQAPLQGVPALLAVDSFSVLAAGPYLQPNPTVEQQQNWSELLKGLAGTKVVVAWKLASEGVGKDPTLLGLLRALVGIAGVTVISLRSGPHQGNQHPDPAPGSGALSVPLGDGDDRWSNAASLFGQADAIICADDLVAHIAGAMNLPAWVLVPAADVWPWGVGDDKCAWYPSLKLFRQGRSGNWDQALGQIAEQLHSLAASREYAASISPAGEVTDARSLHALAIERLREGRVSEALDCLRRVIVHDPRSAAAQLDLGVALARTGELDAAIAAFRTAAGLEPGLVAAHANLAQALLDKRDFEGAERHVRDCVAGRSETYDLCYRRGQALVGLGRFVEAAEQFTHAVALRPTAECRLALAEALRHDGKCNPALDQYRRALDLKPGWPAALEAMGRCLVETGLFPEAVACAKDLLGRQPTNPEAHQTLGLALMGIGDTAGAARALQQVIYLRPHNPPDHLNLAKALVLAGPWEQAWLELEWRLRMARASGPAPKPTGRRWAGEPLADKSILFLAEEDAGDTLQYLRYAKVAHARGARVMLACQRPLVSLLSRCPFLQQVSSFDAPLPSCDFFVPLMSAPVGFQTKRQSVPGEVPYVHADPSLREGYAARFRRRARLRVGIACGGQAAQVLRPLRETMAGIDVQWVVLSKESIEDLASEADVSESSAILPIEPADWEAMAAVVSDTDVLITTGNSVAQLGGAMGVEVFAALPQTKRWHWMTDQSDTPWYKTVTLFWGGTDADEVRGWARGASTYLRERAGR